MNLADTAEKLIAKWDVWLLDCARPCDSALFRKLVNGLCEDMKKATQQWLKEGEGDGNN